MADQSLKSTVTTWLENTPTVGMGNLKLDDAPDTVKRRAVSFSSQFHLSIFPCLLMGFLVFQCYPAFEVEE